MPAPRNCAWPSKRVCFPRRRTNRSTFDGDWANQNVNLTFVDLTPTFRTFHVAPHPYLAYSHAIVKSHDKTDLRNILGRNQAMQHVSKFVTGVVVVGIAIGIAAKSYSTSAEGQSKVLRAQANI